MFLVKKRIVFLIFVIIIKTIIGLKMNRDENLVNQFDEDSTNILSVNEIKGKRLDNNRDEVNLNKYLKSLYDQNNNFFINKYSDDDNRQVHLDEEKNNNTAANLNTNKNYNPIKKPINKVLMNDRNGT